MKKLLYVFAIISVLALSACGGSNSEKFLTKVYKAAEEGDVETVIKAFPRGDNDDEYELEEVMDLINEQVESAGSISKLNIKTLDPKKVNSDYVEDGWELVALKSTDDEIAVWELERKGKVYVLTDIHYFTESEFKKDLMNN